MKRIGRKFRAVLLAGVLMGALSPVLTATPASAGGGCHDPEPTTLVRKAVDAKGNCFFPTVLFVDEGATVTWTNRDAVEHTVTGLGARWGDESLQQGDSVSVEFTKTGVYPYTCFIHPGMVGAVVVGDPQPSNSPAGTGVPGVGEPAAKAPPTDEAAPANATVSSGRQLPWRGIIAALLVLGTLMVMAFQRLRTRGVREPA